MSGHRRDTTRARHLRVDAEPGHAERRNGADETTHLERVAAADLIRVERPAGPVTLPMLLEISIVRAPGQHPNRIESGDSLQPNILSNGPAIPKFHRLQGAKVADVPHLEDLCSGGRVTQREPAPGVRASHRRTAFVPTGCRRRAELPAVMRPSMRPPCVDCAASEAASSGSATNADSGRVIAFRRCESHSSETPPGRAGSVRPIIATPSALGPDDDHPTPVLVLQRSSAARIGLDRADLGRLNVVDVLPLDPVDDDVHRAQPS